MPENQHTFEKKEHLCLTRQIDNLFENGRWLRTTTIRLVYREGDKLQATPVQVMFSVPKKIHRKAVTRNLLKRRMREAYRQNKHAVTETSIHKNLPLLIGFVYSSTEIVHYQNVEKEIRFLLSQMKSRLEGISGM